MKKLINFLLFLLLLLLIFYGYNIYQELPLDYRNLSVIYKETLPEAQNTSSSLVQFSPNMRFSKNNLSYYFNEGCPQERIYSTEKALEMLSQGTGILFFYRLFNSVQEADIIISCSEESKQKENNSDRQKTFIAGEGGPTKYLELQPYPLIMQGEIQLYSNKYSTGCSEPLVELHELLHVFGFDHVDKKESILYPYLSCNQKLDREITDSILELYSVPAKIELSINNISASKAGKYLNFYIEIYNSGLINATNVTLEILSGGSLIQKFEIEDISPGVIRSWSIKNLNLKSSRLDLISFKISAFEDEYFLENNFVEMSV